MEGIINKVAQSSLKQVAVSDYLPKNDAFRAFDLAPYLWQGLALKEKDFRDALATLDWELYRDKHVYVFCSVDAILPSWAFIFTASKLHGIANSVTKGNLEEAKFEVVNNAINQLDLQEFQDAKLIVKGCTEIHRADELIMNFVMRAQNVASSIMFGEPCSTIPIYKRKK